MSRRFWVSVALAAPVLLLAMADMIPGRLVGHFVSARAVTWLELVLATPVVLWGGWPFFERGWQSLVNRSPNMFTLIALGVGTAYVYSVTATLSRGFFLTRSAGMRAKSPSISKRPRSSPCSSCWARSSSFGHEARPAAPSRRCSGSPEDGACGRDDGRESDVRSTRSSQETGCASAG